MALTLYPFNLDYKYKDIFEYEDVFTKLYVFSCLKYKKVTGDNIVNLKEGRWLFPNRGFEVFFLNKAISKGYLIETINHFEFKTSFSLSDFDRFIDDCHSIENERFLIELDRVIKLLIDFEYMNYLNFLLRKKFPFYEGKFYVEDVYNPFRREGMLLTYQAIYSAVLKTFKNFENYPDRIMEYAGVHCSVDYAISNKFYQYFGFRGNLIKKFNGPFSIDKFVFKKFIFYDFLRLDAFDYEEDGYTTEYLRSVLSSIS